LRPGPTARAAAVLVAFLALFWAVDRFLGAGPPARRLNAAAPAATSTTATTATTGSAATTTSAPTTSSTAPRGTEPAATASSLPSAKGVTVQVLNGSWRDGAARDMAARLRRSGYDVVATQLALGEFPTSRIYYSEGHLADALALQRRFPEFAQVEPAPQRLSRAVALHAVVGRDYRPSG
jgi:LytR cell envelope-related transcriptional attenuator